MKFVIIISLIFLSIGCDSKETFDTFDKWLNESPDKSEKEYEFKRTMSLDVARLENKEVVCYTYYGIWCYKK